MEMETADWNLALGKRIPWLWTPWHCQWRPDPHRNQSHQHNIGSSLAPPGNTVIKASIVDSGQTCDYCEAGEKGRLWNCSSQELELRSYIN